MEVRRKHPHCIVWLIICHCQPVQVVKEMVVDVSQSAKVADSIHRSESHVHPPNISPKRQKSYLQINKSIQFSNNLANTKLVCSYLLCCKEAKPGLVNILVLCDRMQIRLTKMMLNVETITPTEGDRGTRRLSCVNLCKM